LGPGDQRAEVGIKCDHDALLVDGATENDGVRRALETDVANVHHIVTGGQEQVTESWRQAFVEEEPQAP
jgi:hypothetical protein